MKSIEFVLAFLRKIPLSSSSVRQYKIYLMSSIVPYCKSKYIESFSDDEMRSYGDEQISKLNHGEFSKSTMMHRRKAAALLADCIQGRELVWEHKSFKQRSFFVSILKRFWMTIAPTYLNL